MTKEEQRIEIAQACGWKHWFDGVANRWTNEKAPYGFQIHPGVKEEELPDYLNDLNAMHEAWNTKPPLPFTDTFNWNCELAWQLELIVKKSIPWPRPDGLEKWENLICTAKDFLIANATATQRAEAFLRTIGKWKEGHCHQHIGDGA